MSKNAAASAGKTPRRKPTTRKSAATTREIPTAQKSFPIVGIGCSAGGLEALESFFGEVPVDCGMAFVVVQHLDPHHTSALPDLIARAARLPVQQAKNRMKVSPGNIYVIPPNHELTLLHDTL